MKRRNFLGILAASGWLPWVKPPSEAPGVESFSAKQVADGMVAMGQLTAPGADKQAVDTKDAMGYAAASNDPHPCPYCNRPATSISEDVAFIGHLVVVEPCGCMYSSSHPGQEEALKELLS